MSWPRTLFGRVALILAAGLLLAQALTFAVVLVERGMVMRGVMVSYLTADVASSLAMLDRLPAAERQAWLPRLQRDHYRLRLGVAVRGGPPAEGAAAGASPLAVSVAASLAAALSQPVVVAGPARPGEMEQLGLALQDGTPVSVDLAAPRLRLSVWLAAALAVQGLLLLGCGTFAVAQVARPLGRLARAAREFEPGRPATPLPACGPREVAETAVAFNRMRERIDAHLKERSQMLGAISHDLQSPITRMRLRTEMLDDAALRERLQADLGLMQHLVEQGLAYARASHAALEPEVPIDLAALGASMVSDYQDAGQPVRWLGAQPVVVVSRPLALRRIAGNLIDNAIKFAGAAEVQVVPGNQGAALLVMDRGPGIPAADRARMMLPFERLETSRDAARGGTGLGLAIVHLLLEPCRARLAMTERDGGGLILSLEFTAP